MAEADIVQNIVDRFNDQDIRLTPQRISVYRYLLEHRTHPTVDAVYCALKADNPALSKTTIYNTVDTLTKAELVRVVRTCEGEVRLDAFTEDHGHFYCMACHEVSDFSLEGCAVPESLADCALKEFDIRASGLCPLCKEMV